VIVVVVIVVVVIVVVVYECRTKILLSKRKTNKDPEKNVLLRKSFPLRITKW
jgi:preprotein translocase subunit SecY